MEPSMELRATWHIASASLVNTCYRIQEKSLYFKCFLSTYTNQPRSWLRWSSQWSLDTWTIKCNCPFLEDNITIYEPQLPHMGNVSKRCPRPSQPLDGLVTELRGPWGGDCLSSSTSGNQKARLLAPFWVHQWEVPCVLYEGVRFSPFWKIMP